MRAQWGWNSALLLRATVAALAALLGGRRGDAAISANVAVNAASVRSSMSPLGLGIHTSQYYNSMSNAAFDDRLEEAGVTALRFGGGGYADINHWSITRSGNGLTGSGLSPWWGQSGNFGYVGAGSDFGSFVKVLDQVDGGKAVVTVNYGSAMKLVGGQSAVPDFGGQPKEAAAWVAYANSDPAIYGTPSDIAIGVDQQGNDWKTAGYWAKLRASTQAEYQSWATTDGVYEPLNRFLAINRDAAVGIKYWEIGNETFGTGYYGGGNGYSVDYDVPYYGTNRDDNVNLSPAQYGQEVVQYSQLMKSIDPTIKIGAVLATPPDDYGWSYADLNDNGSKQANEPYWNDEVLANAASATDFVMVHWYPNAGNNANGNSLLSQVGTKLPQMINGSTAGQDVGTSAGLRDSLAAYGIPNAEIMITEFNYNGSLQAGIADPVRAIFAADAYATWLDLGVTSVQYLEALTDNFATGSKAFLNDSMARGATFYGVSMVDKLVEPGDSLVAASSNNASVRVHAARQADGSVAVMLLNLDSANAADVTVAIDGVDLAADGTRFLLTGGLTMSSAAATGLGNSFLASVPARSIVTYLLAQAQPLAGDFDGDGDVDGADLIQWQLGNSPEPMSTADLDDWAANFGQPPEGGGSTGSATAIPEPSGAAILALLALTQMLGKRCRPPRPALR